MLATSSTGILASRASEIVEYIMTDLQKGVLATPVIQATGRLIIWAQERWAAVDYIHAKLGKQ